MKHLPSIEKIRRPIPRGWIAFFVVVAAILIIVVGIVGSFWFLSNETALGIGL